MRLHRTTYTEVGMLVALLEKMHIHTLSSTRSKNANTLSSSRVFTLDVVISGYIRIAGCIPKQQELFVLGAILEETCTKSVSKKTDGTVVVGFLFPPSSKPCFYHQASVPGGFRRENAQNTRLGFGLSAFGNLNRAKEISRCSWIYPNICGYSLNTLRYILHPWEFKFDILARKERFRSCSTLNPSAPAHCLRTRACPLLNFMLPLDPAPKTADCVSLPLDCPEKSAFFSLFPAATLFLLHLRFFQFVFINLLKKTPLHRIRLHQIIIDGTKKHAVDGIIRRSLTSSSQK